MSGWLIVILPVSTAKVHFLFLSSLFFIAINIFLTLYTIIHKKAMFFTNTAFSIIQNSIYNSKAPFISLFINNSTGFSRASFTATKNPTDSRPSIIR